MMQYVLVGPFRATSVGRCTIFSIKQITLVSGECVLFISNQTFSISKLAFNFFFNSNFFVLVVMGLCGALPMQSAYAV